MAEKPIIFISHIHEEAAIAKAFKVALEKGFLGMIDVFVSSDKNSIALGKKWFDHVTNGLSSAKAMIIVCSPLSIGRPWLNFEAGAAWTRGIDIIPVCHSGMMPERLPIPLNLLHGIRATDPKLVDQMFSTVASKIGSQVPDVGALELSEAIADFEHRYVDELNALTDVLEIKRLWPELFGALKSNSDNYQREVSEHSVNAVRPFLARLQSSGFLKFSFQQTTFSYNGAQDGNNGLLRIRLDLRLLEVLRRAA